MKVGNHLSKLGLFHPNIGPTIFPPDYFQHFHMIHFRPIPCYYHISKLTRFIYNINEIFSTCLLVLWTVPIINMNSSFSRNLIFVTMTSSVHSIFQK